MNRFQAAADLLGHDLDVKQRRYGRTVHYWVECSCGYRTEPGPSQRRHIASAIGHAKRVADALKRASEIPDTPADADIPRAVGGRA